VDIPAEATQDRQETGKPRVIYLTPAMVTLCTRLAKEACRGTALCNTRGKPWSRNAVRIRFRRLREKFPQLKGVVCYCWRHTWTTDALERGVPIATVAELLGHSNTQIISAHYSHLSEKPPTCGPRLLRPLVFLVRKKTTGGPCSPR